MISNIGNRNLPFWLLASAVGFALLLPVLLKDGMFMDGLLYACISKNLSEGTGSFWFPHFSQTLYPYFDQQPPLGLAIEAVFFKFLGVGIYTERIYSFLTAICTAGLIVANWRQAFDNRDSKNTAWLPVLIWITIPVCFWSYSNNMLDNTMAVFDLVSVLCVIRFLNTNKSLYLFLAGVFIFFASLTKGFQGMFPLVSVFGGWLVYRKFSFSKMMGFSLLLAGVPFLIYLLLFQYEPAHRSLSAYLNNRVLHSIHGEATVDMRVYIIYRLFMELLPALLLFIAIVSISSNFFRRAFVVGDEHKKNAFFFFFVGISASFPLMVTLEQRGFYLIPSLPYYAIAISCLISRCIADWISKIQEPGYPFRIFKAFAIVVPFAVLLFSFFQIGKTGRDKEMIHDVHLIGNHVPKGTVLGSTRALWGKWSLQEYLVRHYYICQDDKILPENNYLILESENDIPSNIKAEKVNIGTIQYHLYKIVR